MYKFLMKANGKKSLKEVCGRVIESVFVRHRYAYLAFFIPAIIFTMAFESIGIYPYGDQSIAISDSFHQFMPYMNELQYKLQHGGSLLYSWNGAGGYNFLAMLSYYAGSPLNLLLVFFPENWVQEAATFILIMKVGFAGSFMFMFLKHIYILPNAEKGYDKLSTNILCVAFGSMYALSSYMLGYYWCFMWMDAVALLPLCILGLHRLVNDSNPVLYCISLALAIVSNYYIAYMLCLFIAIYYIALWFRQDSRGDLIDFVDKTIETVFYSLLAVGISAIMFFPTYLGMKNTYYFHSDMPENWQIITDPLVILNQMMPYSHLTHWEGAPNLYCSLLCVIMLILYFICKTIPKREKLVNGILLWILLASFSLNKLNFIWHGFHIPNTLPYRNSFVACFLLVEIAYRTFSHLKEIEAKHVRTIFIAILAFYFYSYHSIESGTEDPFQFFYVGTTLLAVYLGIMLLLRAGIIDKRSMSLLTSLVIIIEITFSSLTLVPKVSTVPRDWLNEARGNAADLMQIVDDRLGRTENIDLSDILNVASVFHYKGLTCFSSTLDAGTTNFMKQLGLAGDPGQNSFRYQLSDPVTNAILNIKYFISYNKELDNPNIRKIKEDDIDGGVVLYENLYPLSVGYMLPNKITEWTNDTGDSFANLNDYVRAATNGRIDSIVGRPLDITGYASNMTLEFYENGHIQGYRNQEEKGNATLHYAADETANYYVYLIGTPLSDAQVVIPDIRTIGFKNVIGSVIDIGRVEAGREIQVQMNYNEGAEGEIVCLVSKIDNKLWDEVYAMLSANMMEVERWDDTHIIGNIHADEDGIMMTSVLYDRGWHVYVDGTRQELGDPMGGKLIAVPLEKGDHRIELKYMPPGLVIGVITTIISCLILLATSERGRAGYTYIRKRIGVTESEGDMSVTSEKEIANEWIDD